MTTLDIKFGSVVRLWHSTGRRGHDYVVCGIDENTQTVLLLKNNCIKSDGSIHSSTKKFHKEVPIVKLGKRVYSVSRVNTIAGERTLDKDKLLDFVRMTRRTVGFEFPKNKSTYTTAAQNSVYNSVSYD